MSHTRGFVSAQESPPATARPPAEGSDLQSSLVAERTAVVYTVWFKLFSSEVFQIELGETTVNEGLQEDNQGHQKIGGSTGTSEGVGLEVSEVKPQDELN